MSDLAKDLVNKIYHELLNKRQLQLCDTLYDENCILHLRRKTAVQGREQYKQYLEKWLQENPDLKYEVQDVIVEGNKIAVRSEEHSASGLRSRTQIFLLIANNKVMEAWEVCENL